MLLLKAAIVVAIVVGALVGAYWLLHTDFSK